jgi:putative hemolysin
LASAVFWELLIIVGLVLANGFFAGAEIAIVAARRGRLEALAEAGDKKAKLALELAEQPDQFLPTVQVGITLVGTFAAVFGGARLVDYLSAALAKAPFPWIVQEQEQVALAIVVLGITFLSVVVGELVPKQLALANATGLARWVAAPIWTLAQIGRPAIFVLRHSTSAVLFLLGVRNSAPPGVSVEDIRHLIRLGAGEGALDPVEQRVALEALSLGDKNVRSIMRPRIDIDALEVDTPPKEVLGTIAMAGFSRLPVYEGDLDHIIGIVHLKDVARQQYLGWPIELRRLVRPPMFVPATLSVDRLLVLFREQGQQMAVILDEFGGTEGLVTFEDVLAELVGDCLAEQRAEDQEFVQRADNSWLVDGRVNIEDMIDRLQIKPADAASQRGYHTVAGLILTLLGRIPSIGDSADWEGIHLEVVDMDGQRIDRVMISRHTVTPANE